MALTLGQFLNIRSKNPDTADSPYDPTKESLLELDLPEIDPTLAGPSPLPPPPQVALSSPVGLPPPPSVTLDTPTPLQPEPAPALSSPAALPPPPVPTLSSPAVLPPEVAPPPVLPSVLPVPPAVTLSVPTPLLPEAAPPPSSPAVLPAPPAVALSVPAILPAEPGPGKSLPATLPPAPAFAPNPNATLPPPPDVVNPPVAPPGAVMPVATPGTPYKILGETYSPIIGSADPGSLASDPFLYERQTERTLNLPPGKLAVFAATQAAMFALNSRGTVWNPLMVDPPPIGQNFLRPALDIPLEGTAEQQVQIGGLVDQAMAAALKTPAADNPSSPLSAPIQKAGVQVQLGRIKANLAASFDQAKTGILANSGQAAAAIQSNDPLRAVIFDNGIIPMRLKGDNGLGFRTFKGKQGDITSDDDVYVPLCFTDLRPVGDVFRAVYFRPLNLKLAETFTPVWNKAQYYGRVDPVATYQSTGRGFSVSFRLEAFGPEDVRTIYQKLHWLSSMVYPEYDSNLVYKSGPVVRMRVGDVVNGFGNTSGRGLPGIIESMELDYSEALWELKKDYKLPRSVDVSLSFTVIHDVPIGRGVQGKFGGIGLVDADGNYSPTKHDDTTDSDAPVVTSDFFRRFGDGQQVSYDTLVDVDKNNP